MPAAGSGYASGINAGVNRDKLAMEFQDQQRRHKAEDAVVAANNATVSGGPNDVAQLAVEMEEYTAQQDQRRQRVVLDKVLTKGIVSGDWDYANDALKANDLPMLQEYFRAEGIVGFHKFDPNNAEHVEMRNKFAQENYDTTYDELNQKDREEFDNQLVVYDKGAGEIELADKHELAAIGGLPERNTKVSKSFEADKALMKRLQEQKRVAQENLRAVNPSYSPLPTGTSPEEQQNKLITDFTTSVFPHLPTEARGPALNAYYQQITGQPAPQELLDSVVKPTSGEQKDLSQAREADAGAFKDNQQGLENAARREKLEQETLDQILKNQDSAETLAIARASGVSPTILIAGLKKGLYDLTTDDSGNVIAHRIPLSQRIREDLTADEKEIAAADNKWVEFENRWSDIDFDNPETWTDDFIKDVHTESARQNKLLDLPAFDKQARKIFTTGQTYIRAGAKAAEDLKEGYVGPVDNFREGLIAYLTISDEGARDAKGVELLAIFSALDASDRSSKYLLQAFKDASNASGNYSVVTILDGLAKLAGRQRDLMDTSELTYGANRPFSLLLNKQSEEFNKVLGQLERRINGETPAAPPASGTPATTKNAQNADGTRSNYFTR